MNSFFATGGPLSQHLSHYESRSDQLSMAQRIHSFLAGPEAGVAGTPEYSDVLVIEAETGIGKSLAYLVPAIFISILIIQTTITG